MWTLLTGASIPWSRPATGSANRWRKSGTVIRKIRKTLAASMLHFIPLLTMSGAKWVSFADNWKRCNITSRGWKQAGKT
jgi:hypothetical protein